MSSLQQPFVIGFVDSSRSVMRVLYTVSCDIPTSCYQLDSNLANLEDRVEVGYIPEFLSVTTPRQHVRNQLFRFHKVVQRHDSGKVKNAYIILQQIYSGNGVQISSESPELCRRLQKKNILVSFFLYTVQIQLDYVFVSVVIVSEWPKINELSSEGQKLSI